MGTSDRAWRHEMRQQRQNFEEREEMFANEIRNRNKRFEEREEMFATERRQQREQDRLRKVEEDRMYRNWQQARSTHLAKICAGMSVLLGLPLLCERWWQARNLECKDDPYGRKLQGRGPYDVRGIQVCKPKSDVSSELTENQYLAEGALVPYNRPPSFANPIQDQMLGNQRLKWELSKLVSDLQRLDDAGRARLLETCAECEDLLKLETDDICESMSEACTVLQYLIDHGRASK